MTNRDKIVTIFGSETLDNLLGSDMETVQNWLACQYQPISNSLEFIVGGKYFFKSKEEAVRIGGKAKQEGFEIQFITNSSSSDGAIYGFTILDPYNARKYPTEDEIIKMAQSDGPITREMLGIEPGDGSGFYTASEGFNL